MTMSVKSQMLLGSIVASSSSSEHVSEDDFRPSVQNEGPFIPMNDNVDSLIQDTQSMGTQNTGSQVEGLKYTEIDSSFVVKVGK